METTGGQQNVATNDLLLQPFSDSDFDIKKELDIEDSATISAADPMELLQFVEERDYFDDQSTSEHMGTEREDEDTNDDPVVNETVWQNWRSKYPWMMHGKEDINIGYCFYCDFTLSVRHEGNITKHETSVNHNERKANYLDFMQNEEQAKDSSTAIEIKFEGDVISNLPEIKRQRAAQRERFLDFNWIIWGKKHEWLVRDRDGDGTHGYCKYCKMRIHVEFSYLRSRHEMTTRHRNGVNMYKSMHGDDESFNMNNGFGPGDEHVASGEDQKSRFGNVIYDRFYEKIPNDPNVGRCKLCHIRMIGVSYRKHVKSKTHLNNLRAFTIRRNSVFSPKYKVNYVLKETSQNGIIKKIDWRNYQEMHPWIMPDPDDDSYGYCKYCMRRLLCFKNIAKRRQHENSVAHKLCYAKFNNTESVEDEATANNNENMEELQIGQAEDSENGDGTDANDDDEKEEKEPAVDDEEVEETHEDGVVDSDNETEGELSQETETNNNQKNARIFRGTDQWFDIKPWCKKIPSTPYYYCCVYCNKQIMLTYSRAKHEKTLNHRLKEKEFLSKTRGMNRPFKIKTQQKPILPRLLTLTKSNNNSLYCKHCRLRFLNTVTRLKHERSLRHMKAVKNYMAKQKRIIQQAHGQPQHELVAKPKKDASHQLSIDKLIPMKFKEPNIASYSKRIDILAWRNNYKWLEYKRKDIKRAYCKICSQICFVPTQAYVLKHQRSLKHLRLRAKLNNTSQINKNTSSISSHSEQQVNTEELQVDEPRNSINSKEVGQHELTSWAALQAKFAWLKPNKNRENLDFCYCKYCRVPIKTITAQKHEEAQKHLVAKEKYLTTNNATSETHDISIADSSFDSIVHVDDTDSDKGDVIVKSEPEEDVLEYLMEQTVGVKRATNTTSGELEQSAKRYKTHLEYNSTADTATRLTEAHNEILNLTRSLDSSMDAQAKRRSILKSSLTLAAYLSPFLQQRTDADAAAGATATSAPAPAPAPSPPTRNTFDLFFESISETFKKFPNDIAAEGKVKIMQLVYDMEMRTFQRQLSTAVESNSAEASIGVSKSAQQGCFDDTQSLQHNSSTPVTNGPQQASLLARSNNGTNGAPTNIPNGYVVSPKKSNVHNSLKDSSRLSDGTVFAQMKLPQQPDVKNSNTGNGRNCKNHDFATTNALTNNTSSPSNKTANPF